MSPLSLVLFTTSTCVHCKPMKKYLEGFKEQYGDQINLTIHTIDQNQAGMKIAREWRVQGVPTLVLLQNAEEIGTIVGSTTKEKLGELIEGCLQSDLFSEPSGGGDDTSGPLLCDSGEQKDSGTDSD